MGQITKSKAKKPRLVGMNHVALEVADIEEALTFYGTIFDFKLRSKNRTQAFVDMGDQFINFSKTATPHKDQARHVALVVDDPSRVAELAEAAGGTLVPGPFLDFLDPWGNRIEVVEYSNIQFTKASHVLRGMGLDLQKNAKALRELADKGMAPDTAKN